MTTWKTFDSPLPVEAGRGLFGHPPRQPDRRHRRAPVDGRYVTSPEIFPRCLATSHGIGDSGRRNAAGEACPRVTAARPRPPGRSTGSHDADKLGSDQAERRKDPSQIFLYYTFPRGDIRLRPEARRRGRRHLSCRRTPTVGRLPGRRLRPPKILIIGPNRAGNLLEVVALDFSDDDRVCIHAQPLRPQFFGFLP
jgi:hypothetical protein